MFKFNFLSIIKSTNMIYKHYIDTAVSDQEFIQNLDFM